MTAAGSGNSASRWAAGLRDGTQDRRKTRTIIVSITLHDQLNSYTHDRLHNPRARQATNEAMGRDDVEEIIHPKHNFSSVRSVYCVGIYLSSDGLCAYYNREKAVIIKPQRDTEIYRETDSGRY